jgi:general secretion pathway protein B
MSYILDALRKAEQERELGQVPGLASQQERTAVVAGGRWTWVLLAVLTVNAGLLAYALWPESAPEGRGLAAAGPEVPAVAAPPPVAEYAQRPPAPQVARRVPAPVAATLPEVAAQPPARPLEPSPEPESLPEPESPPAPLRLLPPLPSRPQATASEPVAAETHPAPAAPANDNLLVWPKIPAKLFRQINSELRLDVHVYSEHPQERFVLINMLKYGEGDQLQEGPVVDEITPDGVILSFRGQRFQMRSQ